MSLRNGKPDVHRSEQGVLNKSFDEDFEVLAVEGLAFDGVGLARSTSPQLAKKIVIVDTITYIAEAKPGTQQSDALWRVQKIDDSVTGTTLITWADGNANFDNLATNLTTLTYS